MPPRRRQRLGPAVDVSAMARGLAIPGGDTRHWISYGTVAAVVDENGNPDTTDSNVVVISPAGVDVDVVLEPGGYPVTCKHGIAAGTIYICGPIHVGDQVLCGIPEGDVSMVPKILAIISGPNGAADVVPVDGDGNPIFQNDRLLLYARGVPIDMRTDGGAQALLNPDGSIAITAGGGNNTVLNGGSKGVARVGDPILTTLSATDIANIANSMISAGLVSPGSPTAPPNPVTLNQDDTGTNEIQSGSGTVFAGD